MKGQARVRRIPVVEDHVGVFLRPDVVNVDLLARDVAEAVPKLRNLHEPIHAWSRVEPRRIASSTSRSTKMRKSHTSFNSGRNKKTPSKSKTA